MRLSDRLIARVLVGGCVVGSEACMAAAHLASLDPVRAFWTIVAIPYEVAWSFRRFNL